MTKEGDKLAEYERQRRFRLLQAGLGLIAIFIAISVNMLYTSYTNQKNDQRWCDMISGLDDNYKLARPGTLEPRQETFAQQVHALREGLHCKPTIVPPAPSQAPSPRGS